MENEFIYELEKITKNISFNQSFSDVTSIRCGGKIKVLVFPKYLSELIKIIRLIKKYNVDYIVIGNGTNILASSKQFDGVVITFKNFHLKYIRFDNKLFLFSGFNLSGLKKLKYYRFFDKLSLIPGCVGGAAVTNCGAFDCEFYDIVSSVLLYDDKLKLISKNNINYSYRYTNISKTSIVIGVVVNLEYISNYNKYEKTSNKITLPNIGSTFKNPPNYKSWKLIKDNVTTLNCNNAKISDNHYNIIVNDGCSSEDIINLIKMIKDEVYRKTNVKLEVEYHLKNFENEEI